MAKREEDDTDPSIALAKATASGFSGVAWCLTMLIMELAQSGILEHKRFVRRLRSIERDIKAEGGDVSGIDWTVINTVADRIDRFPLTPKAGRSGKTFRKRIYRPRKPR